MRLNLLKFVYRGLLTGMPMSTYNPITKHNFVAPVEIPPYSTYVNFKLDSPQVSTLTNYIHEYNPDLSIVPIKLLEKDDHEDYYLSVNIYNCTTPIMSNNLNITRCELNTYVRNKQGEIGTLILDYTSNQISMDPVSIFKKPQPTEIILDDIYVKSYISSDEDQIELKLTYDLIHEQSKELSDSLIEYTDKVFYKNGIYDKVYYDSSLTHPVTLFPAYFYNFSFTYRDMEFKRIDSLFYFHNPLKFVGSMWDNLYEVEE